MSDDDKRLFPSDSSVFIWKNFHFPYYAGLRVYTLDDPLESWPKSKRWIGFLRIVHYTLKTIAFTIIALILYFYVFKPFFI